MDFTEAMESLKEGYKIRRSTWNENKYIFFNDSHDCFSNEKGNYLAYICFEKEDFFSQNWEIFKGIEFHSGLIVKDKDDGIYGIILDVDDDTISVLNENGLVEEWWKDGVEIISDEKDTLYKPLLNKLQSYSKSEGE